MVDTNFIVQLGEGSITLGMLGDALLFPFELVLPKAVLMEAEALSRREGKVVSRKAARGLQLLHRTGFRLAEHEEGLSADKSVIEVSLRLKREGGSVVVATSDRELRRRLRRLGVPSLYFRESEGILEVEWLPP